MPPTASTPSLRRLASACAAALLTTATLGGCAVFSPVQTDVDYQAADGVNISYDDLQVRGLVVVSNAAKSPGSVVGQVTNTGTSDLEVAVSSGSGDPVTVNLKAGQSATLGEDPEVVFAAVEAPPGGIVPVTITTARSGANQIDTPVLPALGFYEQFAPPGAPPAPTPSPSKSAG